MCVIYLNVYIMHAHNLQLLLDRISGLNLVLTIISKCRQQCIFQTVATGLIGFTI